MDFKTILVVAVLSSQLLASCADSARLIRKATYPPDFSYVTREELQSVMHRLLEGIRELDHALVEPIDPNIVSERLDQLHADAVTLSPNADVHPNFLDQQLDDFLDRLARARLATQARPPNFRPALTVVDACARCHVANR